MLSQGKEHLKALTDLLTTYKEGQNTMRTERINLPNGEYLEYQVKTVYRIKTLDGLSPATYDLDTAKAIIAEYRAKGHYYPSIVAVEVRVF